ncbi:hypothetical protein L1049_009096 [Liquidambar formosana]|uniref:Uncharacterized protein n=1 Tax=Liquidambar formosana TaxID=63359 RepID=A0AAP0X659_LIQFO
MERLLVDGNELLRFHGAIITCSLGNDGVSTICDKKFCGVCRVIGSNVPVQAGFSSLCQKSWEAHENGTVECLPNGVSARKAIILCRVIAGRIARTHEHGLVDGEEGGFDSVVRSTGCKSKSSEELIVFNSSAVLPCFVVIYTVPSSSFGKMQSK